MGTQSNFIEQTPTGTQSNFIEQTPTGTQSNFIEQTPTGTQSNCWTVGTTESKTCQLLGVGTKWDGLKVAIN